MQVELLKYEISTGWRYLLITAKVSIVDGTEQPLWAELSGYGGLAHGGERIDVEQVMSDPSQLFRELDRAAEWMATDIVRQLK